MKQTLLDRVLRYTDGHADLAGVAQTPISGLSAIRAVRPSELQFAISRPLVALVVQGTKRVQMGEATYDFGAGDSLLISADVPTISQITTASIGQPYCSFVVELDQAILAELAVEMKAAPVGHEGAIRIEPTDEEVADAALRLMKLVERPASLPVLGQQILREFHYWLLAGRHGAAIRKLGWPNGQAQKIGRAVALLRRDFAKPLRVDTLADIAGMSPSSFHQHFKAITSLSPLQFQKQLRLIEGRRLLLAETCSPSSAAFEVGYESVTQFTREYARMFGQPPMRDINAARANLQAA
jgi:AraC-like DNA-binding protein